MVSKTFKPKESRVLFQLPTRSNKNQGNLMIMNNIEMLIRLVLGVVALNIQYENIHISKVPLETSGHGDISNATVSSENDGLLSKTGCKALHN